MEVVSPPVRAAPADNGGFPEPFAGAAARLVRARHPACGETTLIRVPRELPSRAVRVVACSACGVEFDCEPVSELGVLSPARVNGHRRASAPRPRRAAPRLARPAALPGYAMVPIALAAVVGGLILIQSWGSSSSKPTAQQAPPAEATAQSPSAAPATGDAKLIRSANFTIALPPGWSETTPQGGATFAAAPSDGSADATLWIRNDPKLDYPTFEAGSLAQLRTLAGSAHVADRVSAPTPEGTIVRLAADAPAGKPVYTVTLRVSGPYRYYLATTLEPNASATAAKGVELLSNSLAPVVPGTTAGGGG